jgi:hypothetical protein
MITDIMTSVAFIRQIWAYIENSTSQSRQCRLLAPKKSAFTNYGSMAMFSLYFSAMVFSVCGCDSTLLDMNRTGLKPKWEADWMIYFGIFFGYGRDCTGFGPDWSDWRDG